MVVGIGAYTANIYNQITVMYDIYLFRLQPRYPIKSALKLRLHDHLTVI